MPYFIPTPTLGSAFITFFTVAWSGNANSIDAAKDNESIDLSDTSYRHKRIVR